LQNRRKIYQTCMRNIQNLHLRDTIGSIPPKGYKEGSDASQIITPPRVNQQRESSQGSVKRRCCTVEIGGRRCTNPFTCKGSQQRELCELYAAEATRISAATTSEKKRKYPSNLANLNDYMHVGVRNKKMCPQYVAELNDED
jgi:hypothetical protein